MITLYEYLEVSEKASDEVIEKAYKALVRKYHPDLQPQENKAEFEEKLKKINEAYETLIDHSKREAYDLSLEKQRKKEAYIEAIKNSKKTSNNSNVNTNNSTENLSATFSDNKVEIHNTSGLSEKAKKKLEKEIIDTYTESYRQYLQSNGYKVKYKWTWKRIKNLLITIVTTILCIIILWQIPAFRNPLIELYNTNVIVKFFVDIIIKIFSGIINAIKN